MTCDLGSGPQGTLRKSLQGEGEVKAPLLLRDACHRTLSTQRQRVVALPSHSELCHPPPGPHACIHLLETPLLSQGVPVDESPPFWELKLIRNTIPVCLQWKTVDWSQLCLDDNVTYGAGGRCHLPSLSLPGQHWKAAGQLEMLRDGDKSHREDQK